MWHSCKFKNLVFGVRLDFAHRQGRQCGSMPTSIVVIGMTLGSVFRDSILSHLEDAGERAEADDGCPGKASACIECPKALLELFVEIQAMQAS